MSGSVFLVIIVIAGTLGIMAHWLKSTGIGLFAITCIVLAFVIPNVR